MPNMDQATYESLTNRQRECLRLVARDRDSKEIARLLNKSPETVNAHIKASLAKTSHQSRFVAARQLAEFERTHPWLVNPPQGMASGLPGSESPAVDYSVRSDQASPALRDGQSLLEASVGGSLAGWIDGQGGSATDGALRRLTLAAALTVLIALAIVAAVPMSDAFERFAELLRPYLNR